MNQVKQIQANTLRNGVDFTKLLITKLLEIPNLSYAHKVLDYTPNPTLFLCNKLIQAYSSYGPQRQCLVVYSEMQLKGLLPDPCTFTFLFAAAATFSAPFHGQTLHANFVKWGFEYDIYAVTALLDMYAKLGLMDSARSMFGGMERKDIPTWNSLIAGYAKNGDMEEALSRLIQGMPMRPDSVVWGTMLGACSFHNNVELAEKAAEPLFKLEPWNPGNYVILSNIYAKAGRWDRVAKLRKLMKSNQITKAAGHSFIEEAGKIHKFIVDDNSHPKSGQVYAILNDIYEKMKLRGHASQIYYLDEESCAADIV